MTDKEVWAALKAAYKVPEEPIKLAEPRPVPPGHCLLNGELQVWFNGSWRPTNQLP